MFSRPASSLTTHSEVLPWRHQPEGNEPSISRQAVRSAGIVAQTHEFVEFVFGGANSVPHSHFPDEGSQSD